MLADFSLFLLIKALALIALVLAVAIPAFVVCVIILYLAPDTPWIKRAWQGFFSAVSVLAMIVYLSWIWPFAEPRGVSSHDHLVGAWWNNLIDSYDEHKARWKKLPPVTRTDSVTSLRRFELVDWNPPKHFYVTLKDVQTGQRYENVYVSKHCNAASTLKRGDQYNLNITYYGLSNRPGEHFHEFTNLYSAICGS